MSSSLAIRRLPDGVVEAKMGGMTVYVRESDKFFKVSMLAKGVRDWEHWHRSKDAKCKIARAEARVRGQVIDQVTTGPQIGRGVFAHYRVAVRFAEWVDPEYEALVEDVMARYHAGDMTLVAETVANHDAIQNTTSVVAMQSVDNNLLRVNDTLTLEQKRAKSIEHTKRTHMAILGKQPCRTDFEDIHNAINQAAFDFRGSTAMFRRQHSIPKSRSPRQYAGAVQQDAIILLTSLVNASFSEEGLSNDGSKMKALRNLSLVGEALRDTGISSSRLLPQPIVPDRSVEVGRMLMPDVGPMS